MLDIPLLLDSFTLFYKDAVFPAQVEYSYFPTILGCEYSCVILKLHFKKKKTCGLFISFVLYTIDMYFMYGSSNCHSVSIQNWAVASASFFVLLSSFAVEGKQ